MSGGEPSSTTTTRVELGRVVLVVGDSAGIAIVENGTQGDARALAKAVAQSSKEPAPQPSTGPAPVEKAIESASDVTDRLEHSLHLFNEIAEHPGGLASIADEADLLTRLDRNERGADAIRVARVLTKLLALLARWKELLRSLRLALSLAERLGDDDGTAWALHELGTLHLAVDRRTAADTMLTHAREIRRRSGDTHARALTERNLQVLCRTLRADLHRGHWHRFRQLPNARTLALAFAASLLALGGVAGALGRGSRRKPKPPAASVAIESTPGFPRPGQPVSFKVLASTNEDPYLGSFGDGHLSTDAHPQHVYRHPGHSTAIVVVTDRAGAILATATVDVTRHPPPNLTGKRPTEKPTGGQTEKPSEEPTSKRTVKEGGETSKETEKAPTTKPTGKVSLRDYVPPARPTTTGTPHREPQPVAERLLLDLTLPARLLEPRERRPREARHLVLRDQPADLVRRYAHQQQVRRRRTLGQAAAAGAQHGEGGGDAPPRRRP